VRLFIVDGAKKSRLRVLDAAAQVPIAEYFFDNRVLIPGGCLVVHLTADDPWLLMDTYDYAAAAKGVRIFVVENGRFMPVGSRDRGSGDIKFASGRNGLIIWGQCRHCTLFPAPLN